MAMESHLEKDGFQKQLEHAIPLAIAGKSGKPESATVVQVTRIEAAQKKNDRILAFAQAFAHPLKTYGRTLRELYDEGRSTLTFDHPRMGGELPELSADEAEAVKEFANAPEEIRAAQLFLEVLASQNAVQADVMTHSRGIAYTALAALIDDVRANKEGRENRIRNIVAYGPVGLIGDDWLPYLAGRVQLQNFVRPQWGGKHMTVEEVARAVAEERKERAERVEPMDGATEYTQVLAELESKKAAAEVRGITEYGPPDKAESKLQDKAGGLVLTEGAKHIFGALDSTAEDEGGIFAKLAAAGKGVSRTYAEASGLSKIHLDKALPRLREMGIGIAVARGTNDAVFPPERIAEYMKSLRELGILDVSITGEHDTLVKDPRAAYILQGLFKELEAQRQKSTADTSA